MTASPEAESPQVAAQAEGPLLRVALRGEWHAAAASRLRHELEALPLAGIREVVVDPKGATELDIAGGWLLFHFAQLVGKAGATLRYEGEEPGVVKLVTDTLATPAAAGKDGASGAGGKDGASGAARGADAGAGAAEGAAAPDKPNLLSTLGREMVERAHGVRSGFEFFGEACVRFANAVVHPRLWRPVSIARHVYETGITAIPIAALIAFLISVIIAYMGAQQLRQFGADIFVVDLVAVGVLREMGVLLTAIIVAGRSGSAFAAEIGSMQLNEEVDALEATGVKPIEALVIPRTLGLVISLPLLTVIADAVGLLGGALLCRFLLGMPFVQYFGRVEETLEPWTFWVGLIKAPFFALLIATAGTYRGMQVRGSARELGRLTTVAVVQAIFFVILADAMFAVLFMEIDI